MRVLTLLKKTGKALVSFVSNGIDYACYVVEEFRNAQREDWQEGQLRKVIEDMEKQPYHPKPNHGKINVRLH